MREQEIYRMNDQRAQNEVSLYRQFAFLDCRLMAIQTLLVSPWRAFMALLSPSLFWSQVDALQVKLMQEHDNNIKRAAEDAKAEAQKPKLTIVGGGLNGR